MTKQALVRTLEREREAFRLERAQLIETICRLSGKPTMPTDIDLEGERRADEARREREAATRTWTTSPEQLA